MQVVGHGPKLLVEGQGTAGRGVARRLLQLVGQVALLSFQGLDLRLQLRDVLPLRDERLAGVGGLLAAVLPRGLRDVPLLDALLFARLRTAVGQALAGRGRGERHAGRGGLGLLQVVVVVAGIGRQHAGVDVEHLGGDGADEIDVVADEDERADELAERGHQRVDAGDVEVGRRLVHQQQVGRVEQQLHQGEPRLLAAAQHGDLLEDVVVAEEEAAEQRTDVELGDPGRRVGGLLQDGPVRLEHLGAVLGEVPDLHPQPEVALAGLLRQDAGQELEERRLARAVGTDQHRAVAALGLEFQALVDDVFTVREVDALERDDALAALLGLGEGEVHRGGRLLRRIHLFHAVDLLELGLGPRRRGVLGSEAVHEVHQPADLALLVLEGGQLLDLLGLALVEEDVVVAGVAVQPLVADLDDPGDELVEELPVVRDHQDRPGVVAQVVLEPDQRLQVEMVGRLVQHQDVRLLHQQPR